MPEILFRGKRIDNGEWVEGYLICPFFDKSRAYIGYLFPDDHDLDVAEVDPSTVGQFTGLIDRNDMEIFEGDIINYADDCADWSGTVKYDSRNAKFTVWFTDKDNDIDFGNLCCEDCEVLSNIYDNPELLEVRENE